MSLALIPLARRRPGERETQVGKGGREGVRGFSGALVMRARKSGSDKVGTSGRKQGDGMVRCCEAVSVRGVCGV